MQNAAYIPTKIVQAMHDTLQRKILATTTMLPGMNYGISKAVIIIPEWILITLIFMKQKLRKQ